MATGRAGAPRDKLDVGRKEGRHRMTALHVVTIVCDADPLCENECPFTAKTALDARQAAEILGWTHKVQPVRDFCPEHSA